MFNSRVQQSYINLVVDNMKQKLYDSLFFSNIVRERKRRESVIGLEGKGWGREVARQNGISKS